MITNRNRGDQVRAAQIGLVGGVVLALAACAGDPEVATTDVAGTPAPPVASVCAVLANEPEIKGDGPATVVRAETTTTAGLSQWLERRAPDGPTEPLTSYQGIDATAPAEAPAYVCVFKTDPRPISRPPGSQGTPNGVRVIAQSPEAFAIDAIGPVESLVTQLESLPAE